MNFKTGAGNITITEVTGDITGRAGAGNIIIEDAEGELDVKSGAGNIEISGDLYDADVVTGAGNLSVYADVDTLHAVAGTGNVTVEMLGQPRGESKLRIVMATYRSRSLKMFSLKFGELQVWVPRHVSFRLRYPRSSSPTLFPVRLMGVAMRPSFW